MPTKRKTPKKLVIKSKKMTVAEAKKVFNFAGSTSYPNTPHNRKLIKSQVDQLLTKLRKAAKK